MARNSGTGLGLFFGGFAGGVVLFIAFIFLVILLGWLLIGCFCFKAVKAVNEDGAKAVVERVWEGPQEGEGPEAETSTDSD